MDLVEMLIRQNQEDLRQRKREGFEEQVLQKMDQLIGTIKKPPINIDAITQIGLFSQRFHSYQSQQVNAGQADITLLTLSVPDNKYVGILERIGVNSFFGNTFGNLIFDDIGDFTVYERTSKLDYQIGAINDPKAVLERFYSNIHYTFTNNDSVAHVAEILVDGFFMDRLMFDAMQQTLEDAGYQKFFSTNYKEPEILIIEKK